MIKYVFSQQYLNFMIVKLYIIDKCNYDCWYCYNRKPRTQQLLDLNAAYSFLEQLFSTFNKSIYIELIGGEPTLHPDLLYFCKKLQKSYFIENILIYSNFSSNISCYLNLLSLSKIYLDLTIHNVDSTSKHLKKLFYIKSKINSLSNITISLFVLPTKIKQIMSIHSILTQMGLNIDVLKICNNISLYQSIDNIYSLEESKDIDSLISSFQTDKEKTIHFKIDQTVQRLTEIELKSFCIAQKNNIFHGWNCLAGVMSFYIHADGRCYQCQQYYEMEMPSMFNIYDSNIVFSKKHCICKSNVCICEQYITKWVL